MKAELKQTIEMKDQLINDDGKLVSELLNFRNEIQSLNNANQCLQESNDRLQVNHMSFDKKKIIYKRYIYSIGTIK